MPKTIRVEAGSGHFVVACECGWRELVFTERQIQAEVAWHMTQVHDNPSGASKYVHARKGRR